MLLTITSTTAPATDLGHLLRKHPGRVHYFEHSFGKSTVFFPEASFERCTVALLLEVDPVGLVRNRRGADAAGGPMEQYVNDRPYVASSFLSVAMSEAFGSAMAGKAKEQQHLVETPLPLEVFVAVAPSRGGVGILHRLFEPLGYTVDVQRHPLDAKFPEWGESFYYSVQLKGRVLLRQLLTHLYVLLPVLDNSKHYWVGDDEVEKLLRRGEGWLSAHPERELIATRYLKYRRSLIDDALRQLVRVEEASQEEIVEGSNGEAGEGEQAATLNEQRLGAVLAVVKGTGAKRVLDLGCGEGRLLQMLMKEAQFEEIVGLDVSHRSLEIARDRLKLDRVSERQKQRIRLLQGSLMYRDSRLSGYDAAAIVEVIEHLDPPRLAAFERVLFEFAKPASVVVTTPNVEYNAKWEGLSAGRFRHKDHRFEWTREEFQNWSRRTADRFGYRVRFLPVGTEDPVVGSPTQMGVFSKGVG